MIHYSKVTGTMLTVVIVVLLSCFATARPQARHHNVVHRHVHHAAGHHGGVVHLSGRSLDTRSPACPDSNGTIFNSTLGQYQVICNIDVPGSNILPFILAGSYAECVAQCNNHTAQNPDFPCVGSLFAPDRIDVADDCYLKSSLNGSTTATVSLMGAFVFGTPSTAAAAGAATVLPTFTGTAQPVTSNSGSLTTAESTVVSTSSSISPLPTPSSYGSGSVVISPSVGRSKLHGTATNEPTTQYVNYTFPTPTSLPSSLLVPGYNAELTTDFPLAEDTGSIVSNNSLVGLLESLKNAPHLSRDGGKGGYLNGQHIFVFCDTYETSNATAQAEFLGFVSSSVAVDIGMSGLLSEPLTLQDGIGEWGDDVGRLRGFVPLTTGEEAYNKAMSGNGYRYAIWPDSSIIPLDQSRALLYAPLVYDSVNMSTQAANFTYFGNTLLTITVDEWGPAAQRTVNMMFGADDVEWGSAGGIRSWGPSGVGGMDGFVYVLGKVNDGLLLARTTPDAVANQSAYTYWDGSDWTAYMLSNTSTAIFINETFMDVDIFYSPYHLTFIMVYLSGDCDNTFYYRYLLSPTAIYPPYGRLGASNTSSTNYDYVESIVHYPWSDAQVLYKAEKPAGGIFIYAGSVHAGYYGQEDITLGGTKILLSWTANTGEAASSADSGYALITAEVDLAS